VTPELGKLAFDSQSLGADSQSLGADSQSLGADSDDKQWANGRFRGFLINCRPEQTEALE